MIELPTTDINFQFVKSLTLVIQSPTAREKSLLLEKVLGETSAPSTQEMMHLTELGGAFDFWHEEPDLYTLNDGEPIVWTQTTR